MKILLANKFFHLKGGSERVFFDERKFLIDNGYTVIDFSMQDERNLPSPYSDFFVPQISFYGKAGITKKIKRGMSFIHSSVAVRNIERLIVEEKPQIAHLHNIYHQLTPAIIPVLKRHGVKVVLTLHDYKLICPAYLCLNNGEICEACKGRNFWKASTLNCQGSKAQSLLLTLEATWHKWRGSYDGVDIFLAPSRFMAEMISKRFSEDKIQLLRNGIDCNKMRPIFEDEGYALYFGRLSPEKGIQTLIGAYKTLDAFFPLKVVGSGPLEKGLRSLCPEAEHLGYRNGNELTDLISSAAFVVVPSEWFENCSMAVLEAMALGKPVIGSRVGGITEQIEDGKTGYLFRPGDKEGLADKMRALAEDPRLRAEMGRAARIKAKKEFSLEQHCKQLISIYKALNCPL